MLSNIQVVLANTQRNRHDSAPLRRSSDKHLISSYSLSTRANIQVVRINEMIIKDIKMS